MTFDVNSLPDVTQLAIPFFILAILIELAIIRLVPERRRGHYAAESFISRVASLVTRRDIDAVTDVADTLDGAVEVPADAVQRPAGVHHEVVVARVEPVLDAAEHLHEERRRHDGHDGRDQARVLAGEALRRRMGLVAEFARDLEHPLPGRVGHARVPVEGTRHGRDRDLGAFGDVVNRDGHAEESSVSASTIAPIHRGVKANPQ